MPDDVAKTITSKLESRYADRKLKVEEIAAAPVAGWYEVVVNGKNLVYVDASAEYMLVGDLISTQDGKSLTEERKAVLNKIDYDKLPFDKAIKEVRGNGKLQVAVFSDPDCPFLQKAGTRIRQDDRHHHLQLYDADSAASPRCGAQSGANYVPTQHHQGLD